MKGLITATLMLAIAPVAIAQKTQQVDLSELEQDGRKSFLLLFTSDTMTNKEKDTLDALRSFGIGDAVRFVHLTPSRKEFGQWDRFHKRRLPCVIAVSHDQKKVLQVLDLETIPADRVEFFRKLIIKPPKGSLDSGVKGGAIRDWWQLRREHPGLGPWWAVRKNRLYWANYYRPKPTPQPAPPVKPPPVDDGKLPSEPDEAFLAQLLAEEEAAQQGIGKWFLLASVVVVGLVGGAGLAWKNSK